MSEQLYAVCLLNGVQHYVHGGSGYNRDQTFDVSLHGTHLSAVAKEAKKMIAAGKYTFEWCYQKAKLYWNTTNFKRKPHIDERDVRMKYVKAYVLHNNRNYLGSNPVSQCFEYSPPHPKKW